VQFHLRPAGLGQRLGWRLTTLFDNNGVTTAAPTDASTPRKKRSLLPVLTVLFCISYAMMTMLIVEQGSTIESQRTLIRELFRDSGELTALKMKAQQEKAAQTAPSAKTQGPVTQSPSSQTPSTQAPSSQEAPKQQMKKSPYQTPSRPAADLGDSRRALITI
jgi:hypothetical protein